MKAAWSTILAEEKISNIRTVRAFGMEQYECEKFDREISSSERLFKKLGFGIALFQVSSIFHVPSERKIIVIMFHCHFRLEQIYF